MTIQANFPAIKPSLLLDFANTKQLDSRITYTRASTASFYNGVTTAKAEENLFSYSQEFDNAYWVKTNSAVTANSTTAPDGTSTADTLDEQTATGVHQLGPSVTLVASSSYVISCFFKDNTAQYVQLGMWGSASQYATVEFNLTAVTVPNTFTAGTGWAVSSSSITSVGSSWYRCVAVITVGTAGGSVAGIALSDGTSAVNNRGIRSYTGTSRTAYLWGAQLEQRSAVTAYTATTTQAITNYIPVLQTAASGVARFDNNPTTGESLGLLIEESRTNLMTYSEDFSNAAWLKQRATITADTVVSPDGTLNGDKLVDNTDNNFHIVYQLLTGTSTQSYSLSCFAKNAGVNFITLSANSGTADNYATATFDLTLGTATRSSAAGTGYSILSTSVQSVGNGWFRCVVNFVCGSNVFAGPIISLSNVGTFTPTNIGVNTYTGNGFSGAFIWGAQIEAGAFSTSYIKTVASQVTRAADAASMTGTNFSSWYSINGGSLYGSYRIAFTSGSRYVLSIDQNIQNYVELAGNGSTNRTLLFNRSGNTLDVNITGTSAVSLTSLNQVAIAVGNNDFALYLNGTSQGTDTSATLAPTLATLEIGRYNEGSPGGYLNGTIAKIAYYPVRVTNAQLAALTS